MTPHARLKLSGASIALSVTALLTFAIIGAVVVVILGYLGGLFFLHLWAGHRGA